MVDITFTACSAKFNGILALRLDEPHPQPQQSPQFQLKHKVSQQYLTFPIYSCYRSCNRVGISTRCNLIIPVTQGHLCSGWLRAGSASAQVCSLLLTPAHTPQHILRLISRKLPSFFPPASPERSSFLIPTQDISIHASRTLHTMSNEQAKRMIERTYPRRADKGSF